MKKDSIVLHQTLHGYSNGHHMLSSSLCLSDTSRRLMDKLSDRSGTETYSDFNEFYSGYYLEDEKMIVVSKTWNAVEMSRPGCVWTHSILFDISYTDVLSRNIDRILDLFCRPLSGFEFSEYSTDILFDANAEHFDILDCQIDTNKLEYFTWVILGCKPPVAVLSDNPKEYVYELLFVWMTCYNDLDEKYSFITGSTTIRRDDSKLISLQFIPSTYRNKAIPPTEKVEVIKNIDAIKKYPTWATFASKLIKQNKWSDFREFRQCFGQTYNDHLFITAFIKLYAMFSETNNDSDDLALFKMIEMLFSGKSRTDIGNVMIHLCLESNVYNNYNSLSYCDVVRASLEYSWLSINQEELCQYIRTGFSQDPITSQSIVKYLAHIDDEKKQEKYLSQYAFLITDQTLQAFSDMDFGVCCVLVSINPQLAKCSSLWLQGEGYQKGILDAIKRSRFSEELSIQIAYTILDKSSFNHAYEIYSLWGNKAISVFIEHLLYRPNLPSDSSNAMLELCKKDSAVACTVLNKHDATLTKNQLFILFYIIDPYLDNVQKGPLVKAFQSLNLSTLSRKDRNDLADFCLPIILRYETQFPRKIVSFASTNVHERLAKLCYPDDKWEKLQVLLPEISWFNMWDKCKRVRKAMKNKGYKDSIFNGYQSEYDYSQAKNV